MYLFGKNLKTDKNIIYSLKYIYGINIHNSQKICKNIGINPLTKIKLLPKIKIVKLKKFINLNIITDQDLKKKIKSYKKKLLDIKSYRGLRSYRGLPVNGQRTHTNAKTQKKKK